MEAQRDECTEAIGCRGVWFGRLRKQNSIKPWPHRSWIASVTLAP
jgi:hypothetical protein